jgi:hypothetical protein
MAEQRVLDISGAATQSSKSAGRAKSWLMLIKFRNNRWIEHECSASMARDATMFAGYVFVGSSKSVIHQVDRLGETADPHAAGRVGRKLWSRDARPSLSP